MIATPESEHFDPFYDYALFVPGLIAAIAGMIYGPDSLWLKVPVIAGSTVAAEVVGISMAYSVRRLFRGLGAVRPCHVLGRPWRRVESHQ